MAPDKTPGVRGWVLVTEPYAASAEATSGKASGAKLPSAKSPTKNGAVPQKLTLGPSTALLRGVAALIGAVLRSQSVGPRHSVG